MKFWRRISAVLLAVVMLFGTASFAYAEEEKIDFVSEVQLSDAEQQGMNEDKAELRQELDALRENSEISYAEGVVFAECASPEEAEQIALRYENYIGHSVTVIDWAYGIATLSISEESVSDVGSAVFEEVCEKSDVVEAAVTVAADPDNTLPVIYPDYEMELDYVDTSNETFTDPHVTTTGISQYQWHHDLIGSKYIWQAQDGHLLNSPEAIAVAVIDSGVNAAHEEFNYNNGGTPVSVVIDGQNFRDEGATSNDEHGHGTNVAGIIASVANTCGGRGVASGVKIVNLRVADAAGNLSMSHVLRAVNYCIEKSEEENIRVINMSLSTSAYNAVLYRSIEAANKKGIVLCAAAGNNGRGYLRYPAAYNNVISVAALNSHMEKSAFSNYGESITISAPGGDNASGKYGAEYLYGPAKSANDTYKGYCGTSQATPVVSGVCAMMIAQDPALTPAEIEEIITDTATPLRDGHMLGAGCINYAAAMECVTGLSILPQAPTASIPDGTVGEDFDVKLTAPQDADFEGCIYYTLDGSDPDPSNPATTVKYDFKTKPDIHLESDGTVKSAELRVVSLLFGQLSEVRSYTYYFSRAYVTQVEILAENNAKGGPVGTEIKLNAKVLPEIALNQKVTWSSSDPQLISVDETGLATVCSVRNAGSNQATIRATAADGSGLYGEYTLEATVPAKTVEIDLPQSVSLRVDKNETYLLGGNAMTRKWHVWPETALQQVKYTTSNSRVATVNEDGLVQAVGSGSAVITVMAADGSGAKDTLRVQCETGLYALSISDSAGRDFAAAGGVLRPLVTMNNGTSVPNQTNLVWELKNFYDCAYVSLNPKSGAVTVRSNRYVPYEIPITIRAYSPNYTDDDNNPISAEYTFSVYPVTTRLCLDPDEVHDNILELSLNSSYTLLDVIDQSASTPYGRADLFRVTIGNPDVIELQGNGSSSQPYVLKALSAGVSKVSMVALDGSGKKLNFTVRVCGGLTIKSNGNVHEIKPGSKIVLSTYMNDSIKLKNGRDCKYSTKTENSKYLTVGSTTGIVTLKAGSTSGLSGRTVELIQVVSAYNSAELAEFEVEICPGGITEVRARDYTSGADVVQLTFTAPNQQRRIVGYTLPETAVQGWFKYQSSNTRVATVDANGIIRSIQNGKAVISVIPSGSTTKILRIPVVVTYPKVENIRLTDADTGTVTTTGYLRTDLAPGMSDPAGCQYREQLNFFVDVTPAEAAEHYQVVTSNTKVARAVFVPQTDPSNAYGRGYWQLIPVGKGSCKVTVSAIDGSKCSSAIKVNVQVPVTRPTVYSSNGLTSFAPNGKIKLAANAGLGASNSGMRFTFAGTADEIAQMQTYAVLNERTGLIKATKAAKSSTQSHVLRVVAVAKDVWQAESEPIEITLKPGVVYMSRISVSGSNNQGNLAAGKILQMSAVTNSDATNRKIKWSVDEADAAYASIDAKGRLKAGDVTEPRDITVKATALYGPDPENPVVGSCKITIWPQIYRINVHSTPLENVWEMYPGESLNLVAESEQADGGNLCCNIYKVTYTTGCGKVYLQNAYGNSVKVNAYARGTIKITFAAQDGSGLKKTVNVIIK